MPRNIWPLPKQNPMTVENHINAAVVTPWTVGPWRMMTPAPRKPMPVRMPAPSRPGSGRQPWPASVT